jgi:hypothetical protein
MLVSCPLPLCPSHPYQNKGTYGPVPSHSHCLFRFFRCIGTARGPAESITWNIAGNLFTHFEIHDGSFTSTFLPFDDAHRCVKCLLSFIKEHKDGGELKGMVRHTCDDEGEDSCFECEGQTKDVTKGRNPYTKLAILRQIARNNKRR